MEAAFYIFVAALLCIGPVLGFVFGVKCCAGWFGIELHHGDSLRVVDWNDMPEIYKPRPGNDEPEDDAPADEPDAQEDGQQGAEPPDAKVHAEDAVDALLTALDAARVPLAQLMSATMDATKQDPATFAAILEAVDGGPVELESTETVEITLEAANDDEDPAAPADGGPV